MPSAFAKSNEKNIYETTKYTYTKINDMKSNFMLRVLLTIVTGLLLSAEVLAQSLTISGIVKDNTGEPIIGASVFVKGQTNGTITDIDGNFSLAAKTGDIISVSYIGYEPQEKPAAKSMVFVLKEDTKLLEEVVVIGYGQVKKNDLTGSVTAIKPDDMSKGITNNASDMMVGKIAGVDVITAGGSPGAGAQIRVRGGSSLNANNDPLYVIDGLTISGSTATGMTNILAMINPNDIESFTVLKDASATAIYGSRASNGVIIITTKKGSAGSAPKISYNGDVTLSTTYKRYDTLDGDEYRALVSSIDGLDASKLGTANTDWQDQIFRTAVSTSHNITISGGLKNMPYRVSAGYNLSNGIIKNSWMRRTNFSLNLAPSLLQEHLKFNVTAKYMYEHNRYVDSGKAVGAALSADPTQPVYDNSEVGKFFGGYYQPYQSATGISDPSWKYYPNPNATQNPLAYLNTNSDKATANDFSGNIEGDYKIHGFEDLHIHASYGGQYTDTREAFVNSPYSYSNNYYGWDGLTCYWKYSITANAYAQYAHDFGANYLDIMAGAEESHFHSSGYSYGQGWDSYNQVAHDESLRSENEWAKHNSLVSYFGRLNYTLLSRYMLTATFRADGSSRFAKGNKWGYFPSVALAWKISDESFLKDSHVVNDLKLRLGWGQTGQQDIGGDFLYAPLYTVGNSYAQYPLGDIYYTTVRPSSYNTDLKWETTTTLNAGIDFSLLNNRITMNLDGYYRKTKDLINDVTIPVGTNFASVLKKNIGSLKNYGVEYAINAKPIVTKDFTWDLSYNIDWNHNEITSLTGGNGDADYYIKTGNTISRGNGTLIQANRVGEAVNSFFVYQQVYDENGKPIEGLYVDRNGDGQINESDKYFYKKPAADVIMGFTTKFIYKNWDLSAAFHASLGNYVYYNYLSDKASISASGLYSNSAFSNTFPEAVNLGFSGTNGSEYYLSDYFVRNASYLKCSNITLGYSFDKLISEKISGRVYFTAQNPFIITKYKGIDPEVSSGVDSNPYPRPMSFQLGVNLNF
jgi:iron complex outermembrane receptor protein